MWSPTSKNGEIRSLRFWRAEFVPWIRWKPKNKNKRSSQSEVLVIWNQGHKIIIAGIAIGRGRVLWAPRGYAYGPEGPNLLVRGNLRCSYLGIWIAEFVPWIRWKPKNKNKRSSRSEVLMIRNRGHKIIIAGIAIGRGGWVPWAPRGYVYGPEDPKMKGLHGLKSWW